MKNTIVALLALTGVAWADSASDMNTALSNAITLSGYKENDSFQLSFTISAPNSAGATKTLLTLSNDYYLVAQAYKDPGYLGFSTANDAMSVPTDQATQWPSSSITTTDPVHRYTTDGYFYGWFSKASTDNATGTGTGTNIGDDAKITLTYTAKSSGNILEVKLDRTSDDSVITMNNITLKATDLEFKTLTGGNVTFSSQSVPEPTTATLSLLALAGLAARRRRK